MGNIFIECITINEDILHKKKIYKVDGYFFLKKKAGV